MKFLPAYTMQEYSTVACTREGYALYPGLVTTLGRSCASENSALLEREVSWPSCCWGCPRRGCACKSVIGGAQCRAKMCAVATICNIARNGSGAVLLNSPVVSNSPIFHYLGSVNFNMVHPSPAGKLRKQGAISDVAGLCQGFTAGDMCAIAASALERSTASTSSTSEALRAAFRQVHVLRFVHPHCRDTLWPLSFPFPPRMYTFLGNHGF